MLSVPLVAALPRTNVHHWWQQVCLRRIRNIHNPFFSLLSCSLLPLILVTLYVTAFYNNPQSSVLFVITTTSEAEQSQSGWGTFNETLKSAKRDGSSLPGRTASRLERTVIPQLLHYVAVNCYCPGFTPQVSVLEQQGRGLLPSLPIP